MQCKPSETCFYTQKCETTQSDKTILHPECTHVEPQNLQQCSQDFQTTDTQGPKVLSGPN